MMEAELVAQRKIAFQYNQAYLGILSNLCEPLKTHFNIEWFTRDSFILNSRGECTGHALMTDPRYLELVLSHPSDNGNHFTQAIKSTPLNSYSYFLFYNGNGCPLRKMLCQGLGIAKGLIIYERFENHVKAWGFYSSALGGVPNSVTSSIITSFLEFKKYFEEKKVLIDPPSVEYTAPFDMSYNGHDAYKISSFKNSISSNTFTLSVGEKSIQLSKREWECLSYMARGKTHKEIAYTLSISPRTVESYLNHAKDRTGVFYKSDLIDLFHKNNPVSYF